MHTHTRTASLQKQRAVGRKYYLFLPQDNTVCLFKDDEIDHCYTNRQTATGICDPWVELAMDELPPKNESKPAQKKEDKQKS